MSCLSEFEPALSLNCVRTKAYQIAVVNPIAKCQLDPWSMYIHVSSIVE